MKVLFLSPHPGFGGASTANRNIAEMVGRLGHDVIYFDEYNPVDSDCHHYKADDYPIHHNKFFHRRRTKCYICSLKPDVIFLGVPILSLYYLSLFRKLRNRGVRIFSIFHSQSLNTGFRARFLDFLQVKSALYSSDLVFVSEYTKQHWIKYRGLNNKNIHVVYNAIDILERDYRHCVEDPFVVSFVGRLSEEKNPKFFCELAKFISAKYENFQFVLYGDGPLMSDLFSLYHDVVDFKGFVDNTDIIYPNTSVLLMTSLFENCPMAILEAASYGVPCVAPRVGGIPEIVVDGKTGLLYDNYEVEDIAKILVSIKNNYKAFSSRAINQARLFSMDAQKNKWKEILG